MKFPAIPRGRRKRLQQRQRFLKSTVGVKSRRRRQPLGRAIWTRRRQPLGRRQGRAIAFLGQQNGDLTPQQLRLIRMPTQTLFDPFQRLRRAILTQQSLGGDQHHTDHRLSRRL